MANTSHLHANDERASVDEGLPPLSLGMSQQSNPRPFSLAPPAAAAAATLSLSVPSLPQSHASDEILPTTSAWPQPQPLQDKSEAADVPAHSTPSHHIRHPSQPLSGELHEEDEQVQQQQQQQQEEEEEEEDGEPTWETVHLDVGSALYASYANDDEDSGSDGRERPDIPSSSIAVEDSLGAMALSLFDDGTQLPDDSDTSLHAPPAPQQNVISSLPAFPSLPFGLRTPPPVVPGTPSPPLERQSAATGNIAAAAADPLSPQAANVVLSTIAPSSPMPHQAALPATEPVSSSSSSSSSAGSSISPASSHQPASPLNLARQRSTYSQETNPVLSLHSSSSSSSSPSLPSAPTQYSQHPSMPALEHATGDQPEVEVDELMHEEESSSTEEVREEDGFVRPAVPHRQATQERRNGTQQASQSITGPPHFPFNTTVHSPVRSPNRPIQRSPPPPSSLSPSRSAAVATSPTTSPRGSILSARPALVQSLASQLQSQVESQAWDLSYHYPELDAASREQLIADRGLTALYGQSCSARTAATQEEEEAEKEVQSGAAEQSRTASDEPVALQPQHDGQQSVEYDIDIELSDNEDSNSLEQSAAQRAAPASPVVDSTFCSQDLDDIPLFTIAAQHSFVEHVTSPPSVTQSAASLPPPAVLSPVFNLSMSLLGSPLSPTHSAARRSPQPAAGGNHIARRTRSRVVQQQPQPTVAPALTRQTAHVDYQREKARQEEGSEEDEVTHNTSGGGQLDRQLSIDPEHPSTDTILHQRKLMRDIRKQKRDEEKANTKPPSTTTHSAHKTPTRMSKQLSNDQREDRRRRAAARQEEEAEEGEERIATEEEEDGDFVPQRSGRRLYSATRENSGSANRTVGRAQMNGKQNRSTRNRSEEEAQQVLCSNNRKRKVISDHDHADEIEEDEEEVDKENGQASGKQWRRLRKPQRGDSDRSQTTTASGKKAKANERASKMRQSSLLEHYSSTPTPPIDADEMLDFFTPNPPIPPPTQRTPSASRHKLPSKSAGTFTPITAPSLFTSMNRHSSTSSSSSISSSSPSRPPVTVSIASRRGLVDITNTVNSRQRPPSSPTKQPSNGWRTKRRKGDDGAEWEESPPDKRVDSAGQQRTGSGVGGMRARLRRSAANVGSMRRRESGEREIVVLDATQDPDG